MAYTNAWSDDIPSGSELAKNIDDFMRQTRKDIHERMDSLVADWTADPVVLTSDAGSGTMCIPFPAFIPHAPTFYPSYQNDHLVADGAARLIAPLLLPSGKKITRLTWLVDKGTCTSLNLSLLSFSLLAPPPTPAVISTVTQSVAAVNQVSSAVLAEPVTGSQAYYLEVTASSAGSYSLYMVRVAYGIS